MIQNILSILFIISTITLFSQDKKFSLELNYPMIIDDNFVRKNYNRLVDFGVDYRIKNLNSVNVGCSLNIGALKNNLESNNEFQDFKITLYTIQPRVFTELDLKSVKRFHPAVGLGYTFLIFRNNNGFNISDTNNNLSGFNLNFSFVYDILDKVFAQIQYDFVKIGAKNDVPNINYNTNINILKIGLGYRF